MSYTIKPFLIPHTLVSSFDKYHAIFNNAPNCIKILSVDGLLLNMNKAGLNLIEASSLGELYLHAVKDLVHPDDFDTFWLAHQKTLNGETTQAEFKMYTLKGNIKHMRSSFSPMFDDDGIVESVLSITNDATSEVESRQAIYFQSFLLDSVQQSVIATDMLGKVTYWNKSATDLYGYSATEMLGSTLARIRIDDEDFQHYGTKILAQLHSGKSWAGEYKMKHRSGKILPIFVSTSPLIVDGKQTGVIGVSFDISDRKRMDQEREDLIAELTQRNRDLKQFGYIASHNLRAPITNLNGLFSLLDKSKVIDSDSLEIINGLESSTKNLTKVMNDLIEILIIKERTNISKELLVFNDVLAETTNSIQSLFEENEVRLDVDFTTQPTVLYHRDYLVSLFYNLITNSIYFKQPTINPHITITAKEHLGKTILIYTDNGLGFDLNKIGDKVFGLHQHFHKHTNSRGLGLYLIKTQLLALGGNIELESTPNHGSTFTVTF